MQIKKNLEFVSAIISQGISVDKETNNLSLFNVLEQLGLPESFFKKDNKDKVIPITLFLVTMWRNRSANESLETQAKVIQKNQNGEIINEFQLTIKFTAQSYSLRFNIKMQGLKVDQPGEYRFCVMVKQDPQGEFEEVGSVPVDIKMIK